MSNPLPEGAHDQIMDLLNEKMREIEVSGLGSPGIADATSDGEYSFHSDLLTDDTGTSFTESIADPKLEDIMADATVPEFYADSFGTNFEIQLSSLKERLARIKHDVEEGDKRVERKTKTASKPPMRRRRSRSRSPTRARARELSEFYTKSLETQVRQLKNQLALEKQTTKDVKRDRDRIAAMLKARQNARQPSKELVKKLRMDNRKLKESLASMSSFVQEQQELLEMMRGKKK